MVLSGSTAARHATLLKRKATAQTKRSRFAESRGQGMVACGAQLVECDMAIIEFDPEGKQPKCAHTWRRAGEDFYSEPEWCSARLFAVETFTGPIWDPAAGLGTIPRAARAAGLSNFASDIADRGCGARQDFLTAPALTTGAFSVVTNPPFALAREFVERALTLGAAKVAMIFPTARLNAARWLEALPLARIWLLTPRPSMPPGNVILRGEKPGGGKTDFGWLVFDRTHSGPPVMRWLHRDSV
jgi:hypothetical protein